MPDTDEAQRTALRHHLARRLLDDPVLYLDTLDTGQHAYFINQRGAMAGRLCEAAGLAAEQRAEGLALVDEDGELTDIAMPAEGTEAHVTLLVAEFLAGRSRTGTATSRADVQAFLAEAKTRFGSLWRKSAREPGAEEELARIALERLGKLQVINCCADAVVPLPALARFALGTPDIRAGDRGAARSGESE